MWKMLDKIIFNILEKNIEKMPTRFQKIIAYYYTDARIRKIYWKKLGIEMGENTYSNLGLVLIPNSNNPCVKIGKNVSIGPNLCLVCDSDANNGIEIRETAKKKNFLKQGNIIIGDEVWIGANVIILPGVKIGRNSIIGAGSLINKDVEPYSLYYGLPARKIKSLLGEKNEDN